MLRKTPLGAIYTCCKAVKDGRAVANGVTEQAFLVKGFTNWKDGTRSFAKHESCNFHKMCASTSKPLIVLSKPLRINSTNLGTLFTKTWNSSS